MDALVGSVLIPLSLERDTELSNFIASSDVLRSYVELLKRIVIIFNTSLKYYLSSCHVIVFYVMVSLGKILYLSIKIVHRLTNTLKLGPQILSIY